MSLEVRALTPGNGLDDHIGDLADLRVRVFRDWPYLYDGDAEQEREYLTHFTNAEGAVCIAVFDEGRMVGASTGMPLIGEHEPIKAPFIDAGIALDDIYYCAESVLLPGWRGRGLYRQFFDGREAHARQLGGFATIAFCGVIRPDDHPLKPRDAEPLDNVWRHFGYRPEPSLICTFNWKDVGETRRTPKPLMFWMKAL